MLCCNAIVLSWWSGDQTPNVTLVVQKLARALLKYNLLRSISVLLVQVCGIYELSTWLLDLEVDLSWAIWLKDNWKEKAFRLWCLHVYRKFRDVSLAVLISGAMTQDISELAYDVCVKNFLPVRSQHLWGVTLSRSGTSRSWLNNAIVFIGKQQKILCSYNMFSYIQHKIAWEFEGVFRNLLKKILSLF